MKNKEYKRNFIILTIISILIIFGFNGSITTLGLDEAMYMTTSFEMVSNHNYISPTYNSEPFYDKPPLVYWLQAGVYDLFHNIIDSKLWLFRLPISIIFLLFIWFLVYFGKKLFGKKSAIMDMVLSFFIFLSLITFLLTYLKKINNNYIILSWIFMALAFLTKGPVGLICVGLTVLVFLIIKKKIKFLFSLPNLIGLLLFIGIVAPWFIKMQSISGGTFFYEFFIHQNIQRAAGMDFGHNYPIYSYIIIIALGMLPWSFYLIPSILKFRLNHPDHVAETFLSLWIISLFIFFSLLIGKLPGYIFPIFAPSALLIGKFFGEFKLSKGIKYFAIGSCLFSLILGLVFAVVLFTLKYQTIYAKISMIISGLFMIVFGVYALIKVFKGKNPFDLYKYQMTGFLIFLVIGLYLITNNSLNTLDEIDHGYDLGTGAYRISKEFNIKSLPKHIEIYAVDLDPLWVSYPLNFERKVNFIKKNEKINLSDKYLIIGKDQLPKDTPGEVIDNHPNFTGKKHKYVFIKNY